MKHTVAILIAVVLAVSTGCAELYERQAVEAEIKEDYRAAIKLWDKVIKEDSTHVLAWYNRGLDRYFLDEYALAVADFNAAVRIKGGDGDGNPPSFQIVWAENSLIAADPHDVPFHEILFDRGWAYYGMDSLRRAFKDFNYCIGQGYLLDECFFITGEIYERYGMTEEAAKDYRASLRHAPQGGGEYARQATERLKALKNSGY